MYYTGSSMCTWLCTYTCTSIIQVAISVHDCVQLQENGNPIENVVYEEATSKSSSLGYYGNPIETELLIWHSTVLSSGQMVQLIIQCL